MALVGSSNSRLVACENLSGDNSGHSNVLNANNSGCCGLVDIVLLVVATPVIVLAISFVAMVTAAPAIGTRLLCVTSGLKVNVALCVLVGDPVLIDGVRA